MLSGDIVGFIGLYDENYYPNENKSGINVILIDDTTAISTTSDAYGRFTFEDVEIGNYMIDLKKEGYIKSYTDYNVDHIGGYSPTLLHYTIHEIPGFELWVDSVVFDEEYYEFNIFGKISGNEGKSFLNWHNIRCFFNDSPLVSKDHFISVSAGIIELSEGDSSLVSGIIEIYGSLYDLVSDSVYMCAYPEAYGQSLHHFYFESLGKPSNVIGFIFK
jgi:hypothetical protein